MLYGLGYEYPSDTIINFKGNGADIEIKVTALDGTTHKSFYISVFVDPGASNATLSDIKSSIGAVDPI